MRTEWEPEDLIEHWTLLEADLDLIGNKTGATRPRAKEATASRKVGVRQAEGSARALRSGRAG
jgi:hypothetical protein